MTIRQTAQLMNKSPTTIQRWKRTHPALYRAAMEAGEYGSAKNMHALLSEMVVMWDGPNYKHKMAPLIDRARELVK